MGSRRSSAIWRRALRRRPESPSRRQFGEAGEARARSSPARRSIWPCFRRRRWRSWRGSAGSIPGFARRDRPYRSRRSRAPRQIRQPLERHDQSVAEADQKVDVHDAPGEPAEPSAQPEPAEIGDRLAPADYRQAADIAIPERPRFGSAGEPGCDHARDIGALLLRNGRDTRQRAGAALDMGGIADDKYLAMAGQRQVRADDRRDRRGRIRCQASARRRMRPRRPPRSRFGSRSFVSQHGPVGVASGDRPSESHFNAKAGERWARWPPARAETRQHARPGLDEHDAGRGRIDVAEIVRQGRPRKFGQEPASSTPVGPPPIMTKVSSRRRSASCVASSARSKASSTRLRIAVASSIVFRPGATASHSSWPK